MFTLNKLTSKTAATLLLLTTCLLPALASADKYDRERGEDRDDKDVSMQVGPRPFYLVEKMSPSPLKTKLEQCSNGPFYKTDFSIGHRGGGTLQFPEHTKESHEAGARMGAGIQECDVTFTKDGELVCRHDQCDLHTTTDILVTPLAAACSKPFSPAEFDANGKHIKAASALCCTSDLSLAEFKTLKGKMDASNPNATTPAQYQGGTANWRTDLYSTGATLLTHKESIDLLKQLGSKYTPELKGPNRAAKLQVEDVFGSQAAYAQAMIDEYKEAGVSPKKVWAQSFNKDDVLYWIKNEPAFGKQAVYLDDANVPADVPTADDLKGYAAQGIKIVAPPMWMLLDVKDGKIVASQYAKDAKAAGLGIITWTLERSGRIVEEVLPTKGTASPSFYYQSTLDALQNDGDMMTTLDVLAKDVGILGIFSDWSGTVSYYASCMGLK
ncbi:glycerophosphodiester phosphodiesterase family protein [Methylomonas albis]|uniref:glycerophosphodiester phosphodiesterase n=1 Tax=Methylomonas albis TaxID=1854563 RepID=A0ABR9D324_9GAMM|nr:glycerophosphodiester phosphodiesterase family protein [Methylomonas albis]MBD9356287.1 glycerophosphodiester phosphodiesterase [Methylomonas albis]